MAEAVNSPKCGLFKDVKFSITNKLDVRSAGFHPVEPVLACGLVSGELVFIRGTDHSTPFENWEMEPKKYRYGRIILSVQWNADGSKVAAGSDDGTVIVWSYPGDGKQEFHRKGLSNFPLIVWNPFNRDVLASYNNAVDTTHVMIGDSATETPLTYTIKSTLNCETVAWMSHNQLACGYDDGTFEVHEIESRNKQLKGKMVQKNRHDLGDHEHVCITVTIPQNFNLQGGIRSAVTSIAMNKELNLLASGGSDNRLKIWFLGSNDPTRVLDLDSACKSLAWSSDIKDEKTRKTFIACGLENGNVVIWYPFERGNQTRKLTGNDQFHQLFLSPDGRYLASTDYFKKLIIWSTKSWKSIYVLPPSGFMYPYMMTWDAASSRLGISERKGQRQFKVIEFVEAEKCCAGCKKTSPDLKLCARCNSVLYCSKECQCSHWPQHKLVCNKHE
ncbi:F-box-like/WD repeat-containing protein TBL1XR1-A [Daphnia pulicaria]|uniref:F-box-like/WD repeat-containing protein TBL1XR1-A n=1 Tax=Daphnia pulicaria TaxID=35523 RepID=UPI001EEA3950|nr:F-box-like/WD repeat-containing protein TBL1XR1-A [Daphnia pulicaria]